MEWLHVIVIGNYPSLELSGITGLVVFVSIAFPQIDLNMHIGVHTTREATIQGEYYEINGKHAKHGKFSVYKKG